MATERLLVVDDDPAILQLCQRILEADGYNVVEAKRGDEALARLEAEPFDLLLTDIRLPGLNGLEVTERLRERGLELTVVTMTGYSNMEMAIQALSLGVDEFLIKPFTLEGLRVTIARALEKSRLRREVTRLRTLEPLLQTARTLVSAHTPVQVYEYVFQAVSNLFQTDEIAWVELNTAEPRLHVAAAQGARYYYLQDEAAYEHGWRDEALLLGGEMQVWNERALRRLPVSAEPVEWAVSVPLKTREQPFALVLAGVTTKPTQSDLEALNLIAAQAAATFENVNLLGEISRAYVNARELDRLKGEFINIAGHELRTPLAVLNGYARILQERLDGELKGFAKQIVGQAERLERIANDMLELNFLEEGHAELRLERCEVDRVVDEVVSAYRPLAQERGQSLEAEVEEPGAVTADRAMLDVMLGSLISNAIKFSPRASHVRVSAHGDREQVTFQVQDEGKGLSLEEAAQVFDAFYQAESSLTREQGGLGLGLTLTRKMVRAHGGKIWVESERNGGSSFYISLPRGS